MRKREVVSYIFNCILITVIVMLLLYGGYDKKNNEYLQERITELEESEISLNMQLQIELIDEEIVELVENKDGDMITKEDYILELESEVTVKLMTLGNSYDAFLAVDSYIDTLKEIMKANDLIYPQFYYEGIPNQHPLANLLATLEYYRREAVEK